MNLRSMYVVYRVQASNPVLRWLKSKAGSVFVDNFRVGYLTYVYEHPSRIQKIFKKVIISVLRRPRSGGNTQGEVLESQ